MAKEGFTLKKLLILIGKILCALLALYVVYLKSDVPRIVTHLKTVAPWSLITCFVLLKCAQIVSAFRMRFYYVQAGIPCSYHLAIGLYYVGMFFNSLLPGGIGGDGYKVLIMRHLEKVPSLTSIRLMLSNRASGLYLLLILTFLLLGCSNYLGHIPFPWITLPFAMVGTTIAYLLSVKLLLKESPKTAFGAAKYSLIVQGFCVLSAAALFCGMGLSFVDLTLVANYLVVFLVSSIASILPISIGGAGLREVTFLYAGKFGLDAELGIAFALLYFLVNIVLSLSGLFFLGRIRHIHGKQPHMAAL